MRGSSCYFFIGHQALKMSMFGQYVIVHEILLGWDNFLVRQTFIEPKSNTVNIWLPLSLQIFLESKICFWYVLFLIQMSGSTMVSVAIVWNIYSYFLTIRVLHRVLSIYCKNSLIIQVSVRRATLSVESS